MKNSSLHRILEQFGFSESPTSKSKGFYEFFGLGYDFPDDVNITASVCEGYEIDGYIQCERISFTVYSDKWDGDCLCGAISEDDWFFMGDCKVEEETELIEKLRKMATDLEAELYER